MIIGKVDLEYFCTATGADMMIDYSPLPPCVELVESEIHGFGIHAAMNIPEGAGIGISHIKDENFDDGLIRTPLGGYLNHSEDPNCKLYLQDEKYYKLKTIKEVASGEELTVDYRDNDCGLNYSFV